MSGGWTLRRINDNLKNGYAYIYVSNESFEPVYFDNLQVAHTRGRIIEENHYYAYGLKIAGISSSKLDIGIEGLLKNNYLYNDKEIWDEGDLNWLDYGFRNYDPQIGRFPQLDPLTDDYPYLTPYQYGSCDPITNIDLDGLEGVTSTFKTAAQAATFAEKSLNVVHELSEVIVVGSKVGKIGASANNFAKTLSGITTILAIANGAANIAGTVADQSNTRSQGSSPLNNRQNDFSLKNKKKPIEHDNWSSFDQAVYEVFGWKPPAKAEDELPWMTTAKRELAKGVKEKTDNNDGSDVEKYQKSAGLSKGDPWCGAFVDWTLKQSGIKSVKDPGWALNWRNFGQSLDKPAYGSIATLKRQGGGHVGFVAANDADRNAWIVIIGGNQTDALNYRSYPRSILKFNFPSNYTPNFKLPYMSGVKKGIKMQ